MESERNDEAISGQSRYHGPATSLECSLQLPLNQEHLKQGKASEELLARRLSRCDM